MRKRYNKAMSLSSRISWGAVVGLLGAVVFLIVASATLVWANGLRYDTTKGSFTRTVIVASEAKIKNVNCYLNNQLIANRSPWQKRGLEPGRYTVRLEKDGFWPWEQVFDLSPGQAGYIESSVELIALNPLKEKYESDFTRTLSANLDPGLAFVDNELLDRGQLVTRFSFTPSRVYRYGQGYLYQHNQELRIFFPAGSQDFPVYKATSSEILPLKLLEDTWQVILQEGDQIYLVSLTVPSEPSAKS